MKLVLVAVLLCAIAIQQGSAELKCYKCVVDKYNDSCDDTSKYEKDTVKNGTKCFIVTGKPKEGITTPEEGNTKPQEGTTKPEEGTTKPQEGTTKPQESTTKPEEGTTKPEEGTTKPEEGTTQPEEGTLKPEEGTTKPEGPTTQSGGATEENNNPGKVQPSVVVAHPQSPRNRVARSVEKQFEQRASDDTKILAVGTLIDGIDCKTLESEAVEVFTDYKEIHCKDCSGDFCNSVASMRASFFALLIAISAFAFNRP